MAIVLPQGRLNNTNDMHVRNFLFDKARILAIVGLHGNTFKPHTGTKTSIIFLQKYTDAEIAEIRTVQSRHAEGGEAHLEELKALNTRAELNEDDLPPLLQSFLQSEYEEVEAAENGESEEGEGDTQAESDDELTERIETIQAELEGMPARAKGKTALKRALLDAKCKLASRSIKGQVEALCQDERQLGHYRELWLDERAAEELDYPIFFAVSEKGGKDNSGDPILKKDANGELVLDGHGHLVIDHDLEDIADAFIGFGKERRLSFLAD